MSDNEAKKKRGPTKAENFERLRRRAEWIARAMLIEDKEEIARRYAWSTIRYVQQRKVLKMVIQKVEVLEELWRRSNLLNVKQEEQFRDCLSEIQGSQTDAGENLELIQKHMRKAQSIKAAKMALLNDKNGKQAGRESAKKLWNDWQNGKTLHKSAAAFARYVVNSVPEIESTKTVERWCTAWSSGKNAN